MRHTLPSILLKDFDENVFAKVVEIYAHVSEIKDPCKTSSDPRYGMQGILDDLHKYHYCEFRFGSSLTIHSKLFLHPVSKQDGVHVGFDFDPNTANDSQSRAVTMRENFHREVQEYIETLKLV